MFYDDSRERLMLFVDDNKVGNAWSVDRSCICTGRPIYQGSIDNISAKRALQTPCFEQGGDNDTFT